jgi:hypothetical protein
MVGSEYRWFLLHPLIRGAFLSVALAAVCIACLVWSASTAPAAAEIADAPAVTDTTTREQRAVWPRTVLRLWFLVPQLLPRS